MKRLAAFALVLQLLTGCTVHGVDVEQEQATGLAGELLDGHATCSDREDSEAIPPSTTADE